MNEDDLLYTEEHEWVKADTDEGIAVIGITRYAADELGDVVHIELPEVGEKFETEAEFGTIESVKAVSELYMPISGTVVAVNENLEDNPEVVNNDPLGKGWMVKIKIADAAELDQLMSLDAYQSHLEEIGEAEA